MKKNIYRMMLTVVASVLLLPLGLAAQTEQQTPTETRIAVVSDIHYIDPSYDGYNDVVNDLSQRKMLAQSQGLLNQFVAKMNDAEKPDILLITGDLTEKGDQASHEYLAGNNKEGDEHVEGKLKYLESLGIQVFVIPGNHDVVGTNTSQFATTYADFGYATNDTNIESDPNSSLSYVAKLNDGLVLLAIDSHSGSVGDNTLNWLCTQAQAARAAGNRVIAMMHHPLFPHILGADMFVDSYTVSNYESVRNALINAGVNVILTGHFHTSDIAYDWNNDSANGIYDINTGSLVSYPCDYRMLTLSADKTTLNVTTKSLTETEDLQPIGSEGKITWKNWLHERMKAIAIDKLNGKTGAAIMADFAADLFILHAEGNENKSADRQNIVNTYNSYKTFGSMMGIHIEDYNITDNSIYSITDDKSNCGNSHENQTNDRTLSIKLTSPSTLLLDNGLDNETAINIYNTKTANVTLTGRTLYKDGKWNTLCLPFDMSLDNETLAGCTLKELDVTGTYDDNGNALNDGSNRTGFNANTGVLSLYFKDATSIVAGTPYLIKWDNGNNIDNPRFSGVEIDKTDHSVTVGEGSNSVSFLGTYNAKAFNATDKSILLVGVSDEGSTLYYPEEGASIGACRAYFKIGEDGAQARAIKAFNLNFGDNNQTTGIENIQGAMAKAQSGVWYTLNGMKLSQQPIRKGLYIHNGKKVAVE